MNANIHARLTAMLAVLFVFGPIGSAQAFCGFYVAKADAALFNEASQVVLVRDGDRTVITMASDYRGTPTEFAMVIPVPTFIEREQIHIADPAAVAHLDAYSAPRLVEYHDPDPCSRHFKDEVMSPRAAASKNMSSVGRTRALGVRIEASYTVGEYDILILAAEESSGLVTWLSENGYRIPDGAESVLSGYLKQGMRFFVAKVNLGEQEKLGVQKLRPIQVAYESPKFMLPIRLGMVNAAGPQDMFVYTLTRKGRVETTNYRTVKLPTGSELPPHVEQEFGEFYKAMFDRQVEEQDGRAVFLEYAWDMAWCDPCAADPLSPEELRGLGVFWLGTQNGGGMARNVFLTRLHVRYDAEHFPEDLAFQETSDRSNFQGRYVLRHPFTGEMTCSAASTYKDGLATRQVAEAEVLAKLTGWDLDRILAKLDPGLDLDATTSKDLPWWIRLWQD
jgi:hypothetical protein